MKILFLTIGTLMIAVAAYSQRSKTDKIYWTALDKYTLALDSMDSDYSKDKAGKTIFLQKPDYLDSIPPEVNGYHIVLITRANQRALYRDHNNKLIHTIMYPLAIEDSLLKITFTPYRASFKHNNYSLVVSDGVTIYFKFDCSQQQFVFVKTQEWGI